MHEVCMRVNVCMHGEVGRWGGGESTPCFKQLVLLQHTHSQHENYEMPFDTADKKKKMSEGMHMSVHACA